MLNIIFGILLVEILCGSSSKEMCTTGWISFHSHSCGGHFGAKRTAHKILESGLYWPSIFKDAYHFYKSCEKCQRIGNINHKNQMPLTNILVSEIFDIWGIDFMGPFPSSFGNLYILLAVDYVSKWIELTFLWRLDGRTHRFCRVSWTNLWRMSMPHVKPMT